MKLTKNHLLFIGLMQSSGGNSMLAGLIDWFRSDPDWVVRGMDTEKATPEIIKGFQPSALVVNLPDEAIAARLQHLRFVKVPIVSIGFFSIPGIPRIVLNERRIGAMAARFFLDRGFHHFAFVGGFNRDVTQPRLEGFQSVLDASGFNPMVFDNPVSLSPWVTDSTPFYYDAVREWIADIPRPLAVFTNTELAGFGMIEICRTSGLRVPEEVAVLSAGYDPNMASLSNPALSGIRLNRRRLGFEAGRILDLLLKEKSAPLETMLDPEEIVERDSTNFIAVQNELVKTALHFIGAKMDQNIKVSDLVKAAHTSRATLENRFREALGRTPLEEIHRQKIERIRNLLHASDLSIGEIARQTGFRDQFHLSALFKKKTGMTPSRYRESLRNSNTPHL